MKIAQYSFITEYQYDYNPPYTYNKIDRIYRIYAIRNQVFPHCNINIQLQIYISLYKYNIYLYPLHSTIVNSNPFMLI